MAVDYLSVTELAGDEVSQEQVARIYNRYHWAGEYCKDKDVLEAACGTGQGLGLLAKSSKSLRAGDYSSDILKIAEAHYGKRIILQQFDTQEMPFDDHSLDVIILFEAIYYVPSADRFVKECRRVLRNDGKVLIATANKDLYDFNPSPHTYEYFGVVELGELFTRHGFSVAFFGDTPVDAVSWRQKVIRPIKKMVVKLGLVPKTMKGKKLLKTIVFGRLVKMPAELEEGMLPYIEPVALSPNVQDKRHKVLYCMASLEKM